MAARARKRREKARRQERDADLYLLAAMIGQAVWGKLERFEAIFERGKPGQEMTDGEMLDMVRALNAAMGVAEYGNKKPDRARGRRPERPGKGHR